MIASISDTFNPTLLALVQLIHNVLTRLLFRETGERLRFLMCYSCVGLLCEDKL